MKSYINFRRKAIERANHERHRQEREQLIKRLEEMRDEELRKHNEHHEHNMQGELLFWGKVLGLDDAIDVLQTHGEPK